MAEGGSMSSARWRRVESNSTRHIPTALRPRSLFLKRTLNICNQQSEEENFGKKINVCVTDVPEKKSVYIFLSDYKMEKDSSKSHIHFGGILVRKNTSHKWQLSERGKDLRH